MNHFKEIELILQNNIFLFTCFFAFIGACISSFYNVVILRYPKKMDNENANDIIEWLNDKKISISEDLKKFASENNGFNLSFPASHCPSCNTPLKWYHNIPVLSFLLLRGKCGFCHTKISFQYIIVELIGSLIMALTFYYGISHGLLYFISLSIFLLLMYVSLLIDLKIFILPDEINYFVLWSGLLLAANSISFTNISLESAVYGAITGYLVLWGISLFGKILFKKESIGNGDFKLMAALGAFIGVKGVLFTIFASPFLGILTWILLKFIRNDGNMLPYGPSLIATGVVYIFYGDSILKFIL